MQLLLKRVACKEGRRGTRHGSGRGPNPSFPCFTLSGLTFASVIIAKHVELYDVVKGHFHLCPLLIWCMKQALICLLTIPSYFLFVKKHLWMKMIQVLLYCTYIPFILHLQTGISIGVGWVSCDLCFKSLTVGLDSLATSRGLEGVVAFSVVWWWGWLWFTLKALECEWAVGECGPARLWGGSHTKGT